MRSPSSLASNRESLANVALSSPGTITAPVVELDSRAAILWHRFARNALLGVVDVSMLSLAVAVGYLVWAAPVREQPASMYLELAPLLLLFVAGYALAGLYPSLGLGPIETLRRVSIVTTFGFLVLSAFSFVLKVPHLYSRVTFAIALGVSLLLVPIGRVLLFYAAKTWRWWSEPVLVVGSGRRAARVMRDLKRASHLGYRPVAVVSCNGATRGDELEGVPVAGGLEQVSVLASSGIRVAFLEVDQTSTLLDRLQQSFHRVILLHEFDELPVEGVQVRNLGSLVGIEYTNNLLRPVNQSAKRALDLLLGTAAFLVLLPVIFVAGLLVLLIDGRPVFFQQSRPGLGGRMVRVPKIRTMRRDAERHLAEVLESDPAARDEWESRYKLREDPRLIRGIGRLFRRFSIDELPQLWSVIVGDMSLVGPRPFPEYHLQKFTPRFQELRQRVRPGVTGLWQVTVRSNGGIEEQEGYDTYYIRNWSVWFDLYVLSRTILAVASVRGAC